MIDKNSFNADFNLATKDANFRSLEDKWEMVDSLYGGTDSMRAAGQKFLPKAAGERDVDYANRLANSTLFNYYKQTLENAVYHLTQDPIQFSNSTPQFEDLLSNVDLEGRDVDQFTSDVLGNSLHYGVSYVLVDYTATDLNSEYDPVTQLAGGDRPYWVEITAPQVMSFKSTRYNGSEVLTYFRFLETVSDDTNDPTDLTSYESFNSDQYADQIREYFLDLSVPMQPAVRWRIWRRVENKEWVVTGSGTMEGVQRIPIVPIYSNRKSFYLGEPLFSNLAELNVRHWQSYSDQSNLLHYARFPILFASGIDATDQDGKPRVIEIGANTVQYTDNPNANLQFVEHTGAAVNSGWVDIDKLEEQMKMFGVDPVMTTGSGDITATEASIQSSRMQNMLKSIANKYELALTQILALTALYYGLDSIPIPEVNTKLFNNDDNTINEADNGSNE